MAGSRVHPLESLHFHDFRHFAATEAGNAGATLRDRMACCGRSNERMAMRCLHTTEGRDKGLFGTERGLNRARRSTRHVESLNAVTRALGLVLGLAAAMLTVDGLGWGMAAMFDQERLATAKRA